MIETMYCILDCPRHYEWHELARFASLDEAEQAVMYYRDSGYPEACIEEDFLF